MEPAPVATAAASLGSEKSSGASASSIHLFGQTKEILEAAEAKLAGYDELNSLLETEQRSVGQLQRALQMQQRYIENTVTKERLVSQLSRQLAAHAQTNEHLQALCTSQKQQLALAHSRIEALQQDRQHKRLKVTHGTVSTQGGHDSQSDSSSKQERIHTLEQLLQDKEQRLQAYETICTYVAFQTQRLQQDMTRAPACASEQLRPQGETSSEAETVDDTSQTGSEGTADQDSSMAEGVAEGVSGLLLMNSGLSKDMSSTGNVPASSEETDNQAVPNRVPNVPFRLPPELRGGPVPKRASCLIIARHPQAPPQIPVICKQLTGMLMLGKSCDQLKIRADSEGRPVLSPADFEAAAGCSKGKNWKANIKVQGSNGRNQMLKLWLPGLMQLVGDHVKTEVHHRIDIRNLLDVHSGLRLLSEHQN